MSKLRSELVDNRANLGSGLYFIMEHESEPEGRYPDSKFWPNNRHIWKIESNIPYLNGKEIRTKNMETCYHDVLWIIESTLITEEYVEEKTPLSKKILMLIVSFILGFIIMYTVFSFVKLNYDINTWIDGERGTMVILGTILSLIVARFNKVIEFDIT